MNFTALVVEDDTLQREALADLLKDKGLEVIECTSADDFFGWVLLYGRALALYL